MQRAEQQGRGKQLDSLEFQLEQARLAVRLADDANTVLQEYKSLAAKPQAGPADHYGLAHACPALRELYRCAPRRRAPVGQTAKGARRLLVWRIEG